MMTSVWAVAAVLCALAMNGSVRAADAPQARLGHVEKAGTGPTQAVLIPGLASDWTVWKPFLERNGERFTMRAVTLAGFGGTPPIELPNDPSNPRDPAATPYFDAAVSAIVQLIEDEKLDKPVLIGHSVGAVVALRIALDHPEKVGGVVMVDALPHMPVAATMPFAERIMFVESELRPQLAGLTTEAWQAEQRTMAPFVVADPETAARLGDMFCTTPVEVACEYWVEQFKTDLAPRLTELAVPLLAAISIEMPADVPQLERDPVRKMHEDVFDVTPKATIVYFDYTRHFLMLDRPAEFERALDAWLKGEPPAHFPPPGVGMPADAPKSAQEPR